MVKKLLLAFFAVYFATLAAHAQPVGGPGPGPAPGPWIGNGNQIYYGGCILTPVSVVGGCKGNGTINASALYVNGTPVSAGGSINAGTTGQIGYYASSGSTISGLTLVPVTAGGTGVSTFSANSVLFGNGSATISSTSLTSGQFIVGQSSALPLAKTMSGDCTLVASGAITCTTLNGVSPGTVFPLNTGTSTNNVIQWSASATYPAGNGVSITGVIASGGFIGEQWITSGTTYTRLTNATQGIIELCGGGGGSGGTAATSSSQLAISGGGAGGAYVRTAFAALPSTATIAIGAAGTAGTAGSNAGGNGGTTTFTGGSFTLSAPGGPGGSAGISYAFSGATLFSGGGVSASIGTGGTVNNTGNPPSSGFGLNGVAIGANGGSAPGSISGGGGVQNTAATGNCAGAGGNNMPISSAATAGHAGTIGIIHTMEFR